MNSKSQHEIDHSSNRHPVILPVKGQDEKTTFLNFQVVLRDVWINNFYAAGFLQPLFSYTYRFIFLVTKDHSSVLD